MQCFQARFCVQLTYGRKIIQNYPILMFIYFLLRSPYKMYQTNPTYSPILATGSDRRSRKRKSISWQSEDKLLKVHHFELIADERVNVTRVNNIDQQNDPNASFSAISGSSLNVNNKVHNAPGVKISNASVDPVRRHSSKTESDTTNLPWRPLILIDFTPELSPPGWNSKERSVQAERELCVLGAIDLPGQPWTLDEPEQQSKPGSSNGPNVGPSSAPTTDLLSESDKEDSSSTKIIPLDSAYGVYVEYNDMYNSKFVNGVSCLPRPATYQCPSYTGGFRQL